MPPKNATLKRAIIDTYREQLRLRYLVDNVRRFEQFNPISDKKIDALRDFFLKCIYPPSDDRARLDDAFDRMGDIIRSPRRLLPLMSMAFKTVWKLGTRFPSAVSAGAHTLEAYLETRKLEAKLLEYAQKKKLTPEQIGEHEWVIRMVAYVPEGEIVKFRTEVLKLFQHLADIELLAATVDIMANSKALMESRPDLYDEQELEGFGLGYEVLRRGLQLFQTMKESEFPAVIQGIEAVEIDWYDRVKAEAAAMAGA
jgi:hypothetical protein